VGAVDSILIAHNFFYKSLFLCLQASIKGTIYPCAMNKLSREDRARILHLLCEGNSIRAITRITGASKKAVSKLMVDAGQAAAWYQDRVFVNLPCKRVQVDEVWAFVHCKQKNVAKAKAAPPGAGDIWTWTAICADTKLIPSWYVGRRDSGAAMTFIQDLASRLAGRIQLTSDGHKAYLEAVEGAFGAGIDYAMLVKLYGPSVESMQGRYSPAECIGARKEPITGNPDPKHISTSFAERSNGTVRTHTRRFTRLTNGFSKKVENHAHSVALFALYYNFVKLHGTLRTTPAMAAAVTKRLWEIGDIVDVLEAWEAAHVVA
jgi:IS1 family transposase